MSHEVYLLLATILLIFVTHITSFDDSIEESTKKPVLRISDLFDKSKMKHHYPAIWAELDFKPIIDNNRLFKKYKECIIAATPFGCPRIVTEFKNLIPEIMETTCAKCLPIHVERFKEAVAYICQYRREDYDEVSRLYDPDGSIQTRFEEKYGKLEC